MSNYDESVEKNYNPNWPYVIDHCYRIFIFCGSGQAKLMFIEPSKTSTSRY